MDRFVVFLYNEEYGGIYTNLRNLPEPGINPSKRDKLIVVFSQSTREPIGWGYLEDYKPFEIIAHREKQKRELKKHDAKVASAEAVAREREGDPWD